MKCVKHYTLSVFDLLAVYAFVEPYQCSDLICWIELFKELRKICIMN
jgi:hypothetical protein